MVHLCIQMGIWIMVLANLIFMPLLNLREDLIFQIINGMVISGLHSPLT